MGYAPFVHRLLVVEAAVVWEAVQEWAPLYLGLGGGLATFMQFFYWSPVRRAAIQLVMAGQEIGFVRYVPGRAAIRRLRLMSVTSAAAEFLLWPLYTPGAVGKLLQIYGPGRETALIGAAFGYVSRASNSIEAQRKARSVDDRLMGMARQMTEGQAHIDAVEARGVGHAMGAWVVGSAIPRTSMTELEWVRALLHLSGLHIGSSGTIFDAAEMGARVDELGLSEPAHDYLSGVLTQAAAAERG